MQMPFRFAKFFSGFLLISSVFVAHAAIGQEAESEFYKGYYLQNEKQDIRGAIEAYDRALSLDASRDIRNAVEQQTTILKEDLATLDFASLMPADAVAFVELSRPAEHLEHLLKMMGLAGREMADGDSRRGEPFSIPLDEGLVFSSDFQVSPALLRELKKFRGAAASISGVDDHGDPAGLIVIHPGSSDLVRGIVETGIQLVPVDDRVGGYPTFQIEDEVWVVKTNRLILASSVKSMVESAVERLNDSSLPSLADRESYRAARAENKNAVVFAFADAKQAVKRFGHMMHDEAAIARVVLDLDHLDRVTAAVTATDEGIRVRVHAAMDEDHHSLAYGLIRTVPLSHEAIRYVPANAAFVAGMGVNPKLLPAAKMMSSAVGHPHLTGLDIGREVFANIKEVCLFVLPSVVESNDEIPNFGLVIAANDAAKSAALWNQLLSLPASLHVEEGPSYEDVEVAGTAARKYTFPDDDVPELLIARLGDKSLIAGTPAAVTASIEASRDGASIAKDPSAPSVLRHSNEYTSKAVLIRLGRMMELASQLEDGRESKLLQQLSHVFDKMTVSMVSNEAPSDFELQLDAVGFPQLNQVMRAVSELHAAEHEETVVLAE